MLGRVLLFVALMAQPVGAECLAEGQVPKFIDFGDGQVVRNITVQSGLLTYETTAGGQPTYSEVRYGLYPELVRLGATENRFDWSGQVLTPAADLPVGQEVELKARTSGDSPGEFVFALTSLGPEDFTLGDCTYQVIHLKMRQGRAEAPVMRGDRWFDPVRLITFKHEFTTLDKDGKPVRTFGTTVQTME